MKSVIFVSLALTCASWTHAFAPHHVTHPSRGVVTTIVWQADANQNYDNEEPSLILGGEEMERTMQQYRSKYPTSEADYLAAARARAKAKPASQDRQATDEDFKKVAEEKRKAFGEFDDWEESAKEAGNADAQILLPQLPDEGEDGNPQEPTLLL